MKSKYRFTSLGDRTIFKTYLYVCWREIFLSDNLCSVLNNKLMLDWRILAFFTPFFFVTYQSLSKLLPKDTSTFLVNAYASLVGLIVMLGLHFLLSPNKSLSVAPRSAFLAVCIGVLISLGNFGIIKAYSLGAPQSQFTPIFYIMLIIYGVLFGLLIWKENLNLLQGLGIALSVVGLLIAFYFKK